MTTPAEKDAMALALIFYADSRNYYASPGQGNAIRQDGGSLARAALNGAAQGAPIYSKREKGREIMETDRLARLRALNQVFAEMDEAPWSFQAMSLWLERFDLILRGSPDSRAPRTPAPVPLESPPAE